jgi:hypothetical protein
MRSWVEMAPNLPARTRLSAPISVGRSPNVDARIRWSFAIGIGRELFLLDHASGQVAAGNSSLSGRDVYTKGK